jgi:hypothetical protein
MRETLYPSNPEKELLENIGSYPFNSVGGAIPPLKVCPHWDPTKMLSHILPDHKIAVPLSFRPLTKICTQYTTTGPVEALPATGDIVFPSGGSLHPPNRYSEAIDNESRLRRQDRPLGISERKQYVPDLNGEMFQSRIFLGKSSAPTSKMIDELSMPKVALNVGPYNCRVQQDIRNIAATPNLFNNSTKMQKYSKSRN